MKAIAEIREGDATPDIAALYSDIRTTTRLPLVNLVYRHLAATSGSLELVWSMARPLVVSGAADAVLDGISARLPLPALDLETSDADEQDGAAAAAVIDVYNRGNLINLTVLTTVRRVLAGELAAGGETAPPESAAAPPPMLPALPALPRMEALPADVAQRVRTLASLHAGAADAGIVPSLYLHLAWWPDLLDRIREPLRSFVSTGGLAAAREDLQRMVAAEAARLARLVPPDATAGVVRGDIDPVRAALATFTTHLIPELAPVGLLLRRGLTAAQHHAVSGGDGR